MTKKATICEPPVSLFFPTTVSKLSPSPRPPPSGGTFVHPIQVVVVGAPPPAAHPPDHRGEGDGGHVGPNPANQPRDVCGGAAPEKVGSTLRE